MHFLNVMVFQRQWRKNNGDTKQGEIKDGDQLNSFHRFVGCLNPQDYNDHRLNIINGAVLWMT